jgi:hypothetical protein
MADQAKRPGGRSVRLATPLSSSRRPVALRPDLTIGLPFAIESTTAKEATRVCATVQNVAKRRRSDDVPRGWCRSDCRAFYLSLATTRRRWMRFD